MISPDQKSLIGRQLLAQGADPNWEQPIPLGHFDLPEFPLDAIPTQLCELCAFCAAVAESFQVPVDLPVFLALAVGGAALSKRIEVHIEGDWYEPVNVYIVVIMESGERKSAVFREVTAPLLAFEESENARLAPLIEKNRTEVEILKKSLSKNQRLASDAGTNAERNKHTTEAVELAQKLRSTAILRPLQLVADDATPEAVSSLLHEQGGRIAILSPEGDVFDIMQGRYSSGQSNLGVYLKGHAGDNLRVNRINKERTRECVVKPAITMGLAVQPEVLRGLMGKKDFRGRGLMARYVYSIPTSLVGFRKTKTVPISQAIKSGYSKLLTSALNLDCAPEKKSKASPHVIALSTEARNEIDRFRKTLEIAMQPSRPLSGLKDWANKLPGAVCRIAGIFHGLMHSPSGNPASLPIAVETMLCAIAVGEYCIQHARAAFFELDANPDIAIARTLTCWILDERRTEFSRRDAFTRVRGTLRTASEVDGPLRILEEHSHIREKNVEYTGPGRKPSPRFEVNPKLIAQYAHNAQNSSP